MSDDFSIGFASPDGPDHWRSRLDRLAERLGVQPYNQAIRGPGFFIGNGTYEWNEIMNALLDKLEKAERTA